jgi:hypothetical protein
VPNNELAAILRVLRLVQNVVIVSAFIVGLCVLAITPLLSLYTLDVRQLYLGYLIWGRSFFTCAREKALAKNPKNLQGYLQGPSLEFCRSRSRILQGDARLGFRTFLDVAAQLAASVVMTWALRSVPQLGRFASENEEKAYIQAGANEIGCRLRYPQRLRVKAAWR